MTIESFWIVVKRFVKGFLAGAVSAMLAFYTTGSINGWSDFSEWIMALAFAGTIGGIGGLLLALDKFFNLPETKATLGKIFKR
jgi:hypothetical protein